jgi:outer membrane phospholipase A
MRKNSLQKKYQIFLAVPYFKKIVGKEPFKKMIYTKNSFWKIWDF